jgi:hypothetical protein
LVYRYINMSKQMLLYYIVTNVWQTSTNKLTEIIIVLCRGEGENYKERQNNFNFYYRFQLYSS